MSTAIAEKNLSDMIALKEVLAYKNDTLIYNFLEKYAVSFAEAEDLFQETKKWLWLCALARRTENSPKMIVGDSLAFLDEMWHTFILFTREYHEFCQKYFGVFIHHSPTPKHEKENAKREHREDSQKFYERKKKDLTDLYTFVYDNLGEETVTKWYCDYLEKYTSEYISKSYIRHKKSHHEVSPEE